MTPEELAQLDHLEAVRAWFNQSFDWETYNRLKLAVQMELENRVEAGEDSPTVDTSLNTYRLSVRKLEDFLAPDKGGDFVIRKEKSQ